MSSALTDAVVSSLTAQLDPTNKSVRELMSAMTSEKVQDVIDRRALTIENLERKLKKARSEDDPDQAVIGAYEKLLAMAYSA